MVKSIQAVDLRQVWCVMSNYTDLLIRTLLALAFVWIMASVLFNQRIEKLQKAYRENLNAHLQELRQLRTQNADLSYELSKLKDNK
jgi:fructose-1,6-bisphosphatase